MAEGQNRRPRSQVNTGPLMAGFVLIGIGSVITLAGVAVSGVALAAAAQRWVNDMDVPPRELLRQQMAKAKAATAAGAGAWRTSTPATQAHRS